VRVMEERRRVDGGERCDGWMRKGSKAAIQAAMSCTQQERERERESMARVTHGGADPFSPTPTTDSGHRHRLQPVPDLLVHRSVHPALNLRPARAARAACRPTHSPASGSSSRKGVSGCRLRRVAWVAALVRDGRFAVRSADQCPQVAPSGPVRLAKRLASVGWGWCKWQRRPGRPPQARPLRA
jgi:hypothetical protein